MANMDVGYEYRWGGGRHSGLDAESTKLRQILGVIPHSPVRHSSGGMNSNPLLEYKNEEVYKA